MAKERLIKLPETKGEFKIAGIVTGTEKGDKFFKSQKTKTKKIDMNLLNFGVETNADSTIFVTLNGMVKDEVNFYKKADKKGEKGTSKKVKWANRYNFKEEGFKLLGINIGVTKKMNDKGEQVNDNKMLMEYDACREIANNLKDGQSVFVRGKIEYSSYKNDKQEVKRATKFIPAQVSLCKDIDFSEEDFEENNSFKQTIIFESIEEDNTDKNDKKGIITAKIITYSTIETAEFVVRNQGLYNTFKNKMKPYQAITVWGNINNKVIKDVVTEEDCWGENNNFDNVNQTFIKELVIIGADPQSIDKETYTEAEIEKAIRSLKEFGNETTESNSDEGWGSSQKPSNANSEDDEW